MFDVNRNAAVMSTILADDPGPLTNRLLEDDSLPFAVTFVSNENDQSTTVVGSTQAADEFAVCRG